MSSWRDDHIDLMEDNALLFQNIYDRCGEEEEELLFLLEGGGYKEAIALCTQRLEQETSNGTLYLLRAFCYKCLGNSLQVENNLSAVLEYEPDNVLVLRARCPACATKKRYLRHIEDLTRLMDLDPEHQADYLLSRAYRYHWTDDTEAAKQDLCAVKEKGVESVLQSVDYIYLWNELMTQPDFMEEPQKRTWFGEDTFWETPFLPGMDKNLLKQMIQDYEEKNQIRLPSIYVQALIEGENRVENLCRDYLDISLYSFEEFAEMQLAFEMEKYCPGYVAVGSGSGGEVLLLEKKQDANTLIITSGGNLVEKYITPEYCKFFYDFFAGWIKRGCPARDIDPMYQSCDKK